MKGPQINLHFPCWRWGFPMVFFSPEKRGGLKTHGMEPWPSTDLRAQQADFGRWTIWNVTWRWPVVPRGPGVGRVLGKTKRRVVSLKRWLWDDIFVQSLDLMDMNSHLIFAIWQIWLIWPWSFFSLPLKDDHVIFIEYGYVWVLFKYTLKINGWNLKITQLKNRNHLPPPLLDAMFRCHWITVPHFWRYLPQAALLSVMLRGPLDLQEQVLASRLSAFRPGGFGKTSSWETLRLERSRNGCK